MPMSFSEAVEYHKRNKIICYDGCTERKCKEVQVRMAFAREINRLDAKVSDLLLEIKISEIDCEDV